MRKTSKLRLDRQIIRNLSPLELDRVRGGGSAVCAPTWSICLQGCTGGTT